jgi:hypothetical protein
MDVTRAGRPATPDNDRQLQADVLDDAGPGVDVRVTIAVLIGSPWCCCVGFLRKRRVYEEGADRLVMQFGPVGLDHVPRVVDRKQHSAR